MALSNYTELKAEIADWLKRGDMAGRIPTFITLAEARINRLASVRRMEVEAPLTMTVGSRLVALPDDFSVPRVVWLETVQPRQELSPLVPEQNPVTNVAGWPRYWAVDGENLAFDRPADVAHQITLRYCAQFKLTDASPTNALLTQYPDVYLHAALFAAFLHVRNNEQATAHKGLFDEAVKDMNENESRSRAVAPLRTELAQFPGIRFDIRRGY